MTPSRWFVAKDEDKYVIRRKMGNKSVRYPRGKYAHCKTFFEVSAYCTRLNHEEGFKAKERAEIQTAFIPQHVLDSFRDMLVVSIPNEKDFNYQYNTVLKAYFLNFFITTLQLPDPKQWVKNQEKWGAALLGKSEEYPPIFGFAPSEKTLKTTIQLANRFMQFLNQKMPEEYPPVRLEPLSRAAIREHEASRKLLEFEPVGRYIPEEDWAKIETALPENIACFVKLMYYYGLRRAESLGFTSTDRVRRACLEVKTQYRSKKAGMRPVKMNKAEGRDTPHWFCTPKEAFELVKASSLVKMHPDTLSEHWETLREKIGVAYNLHDFRRTFITRALRLYPLRDVQQAVGHEDPRTTMRYAQDDRNLDKEVWKPD